jgi:hypothetical protein
VPGVLRLFLTVYRWMEASVVPDDVVTSLPAHN